MESLEGRIILEDLVGSGGSAEVFRGVDLATGRAVAVKRLRADFGDPVARARFEREARLLADIQSPHLVSYVTHGADSEGRFCLVTEWLRGETVDERISRGRISDFEVLRVIREAALGLAALHEAGILHRDVKPSNMFLAEGEDGRSVKLLDLGIALASGDLALTGQDLVIGSPVYISPEQVRGEEPTAASDLYALSVVFYELLTGQRPFQGTDTVTVLRQVLSEAPPRLRASRPDLPGALDALLDRCFAKDPSRRPAHVLDLVEEATALLDPLATRPDGLRIGPRIAEDERRVRVLLRAQVLQGDAGAALNALAEAIESRGGRVERRSGLSLDGVFGDQRTRGDEIVRAAQAAQAARRPGVRMALVAGMTWRAGAALEGDPLRRVATLLTTAREGEVRLDEPTAVVLSSRFAVSSRRKGMVLGDDATPPPWVPASGLPAALLAPPGRSHELELITGILHDAWVQRAPRLVAVWGETGTGKTRLAQAVCASLAERVPAGARGPGVLVVRGDTMLASTPLGVLGRALREQAGIDDTAPLEERRRRLHAFVDRLRADVAPEFVGELARVSWSEQPTPALRSARRDPQRMHERLRATAIELMRSVSERAPQLLVVEDIQWFDEPSLELLAILLKVLEGKAFAAVALGRPDSAVAERTERAWRGVSRTDLRLGPIPLAAAMETARRVLGPEADSGRVHALVARAEGNPLFLEELLHAEADREDEGPTPLPVTALAAVQRRFDNLDLDARRVLRAASVFGRTFTRGGVERLLEPVSAATMTRSLALLRAEGFVVPQSGARARAAEEYGFRHTVARDAAYASIAEADLRVLHERAASYIDEAQTQRVGAAAVAEHYERAQRDDAAAIWWARAAEESAHAQHWDAVRAQVARALGRQPPDLLRRVLLCLRAEASFALGDGVAAIDDARAAESLPGATADERLRVALCVAEGQYLDGRVDAAISTLHAARAIVRASRRGVGSVPYGARWYRAAIRQADWLVSRGDAEHALALLDEAAADPRLSGDDLDALGAETDAVRGAAALVRGHLEAALATAQTARARAAQDRNGDGFVRATLAESVAWRRQARWPEALARATEARDRARRDGLAALEALAQRHVAFTLARSERHDESRSAFAAASLLAERARLPSVALAARVYASWARALDPRVDASLDLAIAWIEVTDASNAAPALSCLARAVRAHLLLRLRGPVAAIAPATEAAVALDAGVALEDGASYVRWVRAATLAELGDPDGCTLAEEAWIELEGWGASIRDPAARAAYLELPLEHRALRALRPGAGG
ncbi:MAG: protein kinase [Polyangiales bacterium]